MKNKFILFTVCLLFLSCDKYTYTHITSPATIVGKSDSIMDNKGVFHGYDITIKDDKGHLYTFPYYTDVARSLSNRQQGDTL